MLATKQDSPSPSPEPPAKAPKRSPSTSTDTATESESESESEPAAAHSVPDARTATPQKNPAVKIGIIGGRRPPTSSKEQKMQTRSPEPSASTDQSPPPRPRPKLGAIGGQKSRTASLSPTASLNPTLSPSPSAPPGVDDAKQRATGAIGAQRRARTPPEMEEPMTEAERANQKRLELKRQLDQRGGGGKKKRRF